MSVQIPATVGELATGLLAHSSRLVIPVLLLVGVLCAICLNLDAKLPVLTGERWLTVGHMMMPATFFVIAVVVVVLNLIADLIYAALDPRVVYR